MVKPELSEILKNQKTIIKLLKKIDNEEIKELAEEDEMGLDEEQELSELKKLESIEQELAEEVKVKPLSRITHRDFYKAIVGALFGIMGHFSFFYGVEIAHGISVLRASFLYVIAFVIGLVFLYATGYKKIDPKTVYKVIPLRLFTIYFTSIMVILIVLFVFDFIGLHSSFVEIYKTVAAISILAVMGAITADLIGKSE